MHRLLQTLAPKLLITKFVSHLANSRLFSKPFISWFSRRYKVNLGEAKIQDLKGYQTFNQFFTRELKEGARVIASDKGAFISPADGVISQFGQIESGRIIQAKGHTFSVREFLATTNEQASSFNDGGFFTIYLSPKDYHRVHFPFDCTVTKMTYIPGKLFSVSPKTAALIPNLFARNERLCVFVETAFGPVVIVLVGAMIVAGIATVWGGTIKRTNTVTSWEYGEQETAHQNFKKGEQLGHFELGSTVVVLTSKDALTFSEGLEEESPVKMGQALGQLQAH